MSTIIHQKIVTETDKPAWKDTFKKREYEYLTHVINGLIEFGEFDEFIIQFGDRNSVRAFHIFEPFVTLNYLGFTSPSVVSILFSKGDEIWYSTGGNNGIGIFSSELTLESSRNFPRNSMLEIDFWHFVDAIGEEYRSQIGTLYMYM